MDHENEGHYSIKHPKGTRYNPRLAAALKDSVDDDRVSCAVAHDLAETYHVTSAEIGKTADLLEYRIVKCQMGLFGFSPEKRIVKPLQDVPDDLRARMEAATEDGGLTCKQCWEIADELGVTKLKVAGACEGLGLKIKNCQLGAF